MLRASDLALLRDFLHVTRARGSRCTLIGAGARVLDDPSAGEQAGRRHELRVGIFGTDRWRSSWFYLPPPWPSPWP